MNELQNFGIGTVIYGEWNGRSYWISEFVGSGVGGVIYKAKSIYGDVIIKLCDSSSVVTSELKIFKELFPQGGGISRAKKCLFPQLLDVDDYLGRHTNIPFYVMECVLGDSLLEYITVSNNNYFWGLLGDLLAKLSALHELGYMFGNLTSGDLIVTGQGRVCCVNVGIVRKIGEKVDDFTMYNNYNSREEGGVKNKFSYDLFSVAIIIIEVISQNKISSRDISVKKIKKMILAKKELRGVRKILNKALNGKYISIRDMEGDLDEKIKKSEHRNVKEDNYKAKYRQKRESKIEMFMLTFGALTVYMLYIWLLNN